MCIINFNDVPTKKKKKEKKSICNKTVPIGASNNNRNMTSKNYCNIIMKPAVCYLPYFVHYNVFMFYSRVNMLFTYILDYDIYLYVLNL